MRLPQNVFLNVTGYAVFLVCPADGEAQGLHVLAGIAHRDADACCLQHGYVVEAVAKGQQLVHPEAEMLSAPAQGIALGRPQGIALQEVGLGAGQRRPPCKECPRLSIQLGNALRGVHHQQLRHRLTDEGR